MNWLTLLLIVLAFLASYCGYVLVRFMLVWREHGEWERSLKRRKV
jgi:hypothetical protein